MKCVSAYDFNDRLIEGRIYTNKKGESFIINKFGESLSTKNIKTYRIYEELSDEEVQDVVNKELNDLHVEDNDKLKNLSPTDLEKTGDEREKELKANGFEIKDGDYKDKFVVGVKAANASEKASAGSISDSEALKSVLDENSAYKFLSNEIDNYTKTTDIFNETKLLEHLCNVCKVDIKNIKGATLSESVKNILHTISK